MKLNTFLLSCMATTSTVLAFNNIDFNLNHGGIYAVKLNNTLPVFSNISKECQTELENSELLEKCSFAVTIDNLKENCEAVFSDECTKFLSDLISNFPSCKNEKSINDLSTGLKTSQVYAKYYCTLNGDGESCPNAIQTMTTHELIYNNTIQDCAYKSCVDNRIAMLEDNKKYGELRNSLYINNYVMSENSDFDDTFIGYLKSPECTAMTKDDTANSKFIFDDGSKKKNEDTKSGAESVKKFTSILLSLFLIYVIF